MRALFFGIIGPLLSLPRPAKRLVVFCVDISFCILTVWLAYYLRLGQFVPLKDAAFITVIISIFVAVPIFVLFGLYRSIFRYIGWTSLVSITQAVSVYGIIFFSIFTAIGITGVPRTIGVIQPILLLLFVGASRMFARFWLGNEGKARPESSFKTRVLIYGAGRAGRQLAASLSSSSEMSVVGFLDDDKHLHGHYLDGLLVYDPTVLSVLSQKLNLGYILLAMPSISRQRHTIILDKISTAQIPVRTLPSVSDLVQGKVTVSDLRELDIHDLLGREPVEPNSLLLSKNVSGKTIMVTGAGGSIGSELCRQILLVEPENLLLLEQNEFALYNIHQELESKGTTVRLIPLLASVQDMGRMKQIMSTWKPYTVYHAAAYKHVPLVEHNLAEGIKNNVLGTLVTAQSALENNVPNFVLISTDKAVRPTNIMGASKRLSEMILQALAAQNTSVKFSMVRFGNVLGSSGSVVPKFRKQIREGGPITITHPSITRFFMTISEASQLVIQAGAMAKGGDVFVLDMGKPVKIMDLARRMIELSGLSLKNKQNPNGDIEIEITDLRPGEKLYEELLIGDNPEHTAHARIMKAHEKFIPWYELEDKIKTLTVALKANDVSVIRHLLENLVPDYMPSQKIVDWVHLEQYEESGIDKPNF